MSDVLLQLNGKSESFRLGTTVADLVESLNLSPSGVAIAVNQMVVPCSERHNTLLHASDRVEIIQAVGGG